MRMTPNRRIALNIATTYARSLYKLALGLVTARWLLLALGQVDYGLLGLVGGLIAFVTMINRLLAGAVSRYFALSIGAAKKKGNEENGLQECRRWFSAAVSVHTVIPLILVAIGWPLGEYAVRHWLVIPPARIQASLWVWRFTCISALVGMFNVPFRAMYTAKQEIVERTFYSMAATTLSALLLYYMVTHPGEWLAKYAFWHCLIVLVPRVIICVRAICIYPECRLRRDCIWRWRDIRELALFSLWNAFGAFGRVVRSQGLAVIVNRFFGAASNAAVAVASRLSARANTFATSMASSFNPAIVTAYGAGNLKRMKALVFRLDKLSAMMVVVFSVPLSLEVHEVMRLWLKKPPAESPGLCVCVMLTTLLGRMCVGQSIAISATGKIALNRFMDGTARILAVPIALAFVSAGCGLFSVVYASVISSVMANVIHVWNANRLAGVSAARWFYKVFLPVLISVVASGCAGLLPRLSLPAGPTRVLLTAFACELAFLPLGWFVLLDAEEKEFMRSKWAKAWQKFKRTPGAGQNGKGGAS